jgi:predicted RNase H-like nuclease (RuvC/YqgF family)
MGSESLDDTDASLEETVAVNSDNITRIFAEQERFRERLHTLESDRATVLLLAQKVDNLARDLPEQVRRAAELAAEIVAERATRARTSNWQVRLGVTAAIIAAVGILIQTGLRIYG